MNFSLHKQYAEYPNLQELEILFSDLLDSDESRNTQCRDDVVNTFFILCEKHWHIYSRPSNNVQHIVESWVLDVWDPNKEEWSDDVFQSVLMLGLVDLFEKMLTKISACPDNKTKNIFLKDIEEHRKYVEDPWHSM